MSERINDKINCNSSQHGEKHSADELALFSPEGKPEEALASQPLPFLSLAKGSVSWCRWSWPRPCTKLGVGPGGRWGVEAGMPVTEDQGESSRQTSWAGVLGAEGPPRRRTAGRGVCPGPTASPSPHCHSPHHGFLKGRCPALNVGLPQGGRGQEVVGTAVRAGSGRQP